MPMTLACLSRFTAGAGLISCAYTHDRSEKLTERMAHRRPSGIAAEPAEAPVFRRRRRCQCRGSSAPGGALLAGGQLSADLIGFGSVKVHVEGEGLHPVVVGLG